MSAYDDLKVSLKAVRASIIKAIALIKSLRGGGNGGGSGNDSQEMKDLVIALDKDIADLDAEVGAGNPSPNGKPQITGTAQEDQTLTCDTAGIVDPDGLGPFTYQWMSNDVDIAGQVAKTFLVANSNVGKQISVKVTYTNGKGVVKTSTSDKTVAVAPK